MANATPVTKAAPEAEAPAPADERLMPPAEAPKPKAKAEKADKGDLDALVAAAEKDGKTAVVTGNAVRVDN